MPSPAPPSFKSPSFTLRYWKNDLPAGVVVFLVALPLCLGIALASGAELFSGVIAGIVGGIVVGSFSGSQLGVSGPAAGLAVIVLEGIKNLGFEPFLLAVVLAGMLQLIAGFARAGIIAYYFPSSVIKGMLAGIGVLLILKQIPHALGNDADPEGDFSFWQIDGKNTLTEIVASVVNNSPGAIIITLISLAILIAWTTKPIKNNKILGPIPAPLLVVGLGILINNLYRVITPSLALDNTGPNNHLVNIPVAGSINEFFNFLTLPDFGSITNSAVLVTAITIAVVASLETLLCVDATDKLDPHRRVTPTNQELKAQGIGNMVSGLIGGLPVTQVIVRSTANISSGGRTKLAAIIHGFFLLTCVALIPSLLNEIPLSSLAAILLMVGYRLARISLFQSMYKLGWGQFLPFLITILAIVFTDLLRGIAIGMVVAIFYILINNYRNAYSFRRVEHTLGSRTIITLAEEVSFLNKGSVLNTLTEIHPGTDLLIDGTRNRFIDHDVLEILKDFQQHAAERGIKVEVVGIDLDAIAVGGH